MTKVKGKGSILTTRFVGNKKWLFPDTKTLVLLSIEGNVYCRGDFLREIIKHSLTTNEFSTFLIADEIYWHNLKLCKNPSPEEQQALKCQAMDLGDKYIEEQLAGFLMPLGVDPANFEAANFEKSITEKLAIINQLAKKHNFEILRWPDWAANLPDKSAVCLDKMLGVYSSDEVLENSVNSQAQNFARRHVAMTSSNELFDLFYSRSQGYLREESFYIMWLGAYLNYNFIVYPGDMPKPFIATKDYFVKNMSYNQADVDIMIKTEKPELLVNWLHVNFVRKHAPKAIQEIFAAPKDADAGKAGLITSNTGNLFFGKPGQPDKSTLNSELSESNPITVMTGVAQAVLESNLPIELKKNFIIEFVERLSAESSKAFGSNSYNAAPSL